MKIDVRVGGSRYQFASQTTNVIPFIKELFRQSFIGNETPDFYEGLLAGFSGAYAILEQMPLETGKQCIGSFLALIAEEMK